jgi:hypothetical protein
MSKAKYTNDKQALQYWESFRENIFASTDVDKSETLEAQKNRIAHLEANPEEWFVYYFPKYCSAKPAKFHIDATKRWLKNPRWYEVRAWSRELSKSTRAMFEDLYLLLTGKSKYKVMVSFSESQAIKLFMPYMLNLESNQRIIHDYGRQKKAGSWNVGDITTRSGFSIVCFGVGQSPRGIRKEEARPDILDFDDIDTDEAVRNPDRVKEMWRWIEQAAIPTMSISGNRRIRFNGNIIAKYCVITEAMKQAKHVDVINIRDKNGKSTWDKNSEQHIDEVLAEISWMSSQKEYFNNPVSEGDVFKEMTFGKLPALHTCDAVLVYSDPSTSNKDKGNSASNKCVAVIGRKLNKYYVYKCWLEQASNARFIDWLYGSYMYMNDAKVDVKKIYVENNTLQDPFYEQVLLPLIFEQGKKYNLTLPITPDTRKKPDKFFRIEGTLEPLNRLGLLILNIDEENEPSMKRLKEQFLAVSAKSKTMDGPDTIEGGVHILMHNYANIGQQMTIKKRSPNNKRY